MADRLNRPIEWEAFQDLLPVGLISGAPLPACLRIVIGKLFGGARPSSRPALPLTLHQPWQRLRAGVHDVTVHLVPFSAKLLGVKASWPTRIAISTSALLLLLTSCRDADADRRQEAGEGDRGEEAAGETAQVGLGTERSAGRLLRRNRGRNSMDVKEASAMTEASGLVDEQDGFEQISGAGRRPLQSPSQEVATRLTDRLREVTVKAPLQALFAAFLLGVWVARRR